MYSLVNSCRMWGEKNMNAPTLTHTSLSNTQILAKQYCLLFTNDIFIPYETAFISSYADPCGSVFVVQDKRMGIERHNGVK